ncbi:MAG: T9SS type A sorting domain-containing protein [bacterium]
MRRRLTVFVLMALAALIPLASIQATPYVPPEKIETHIGENVFQVPGLDATYNHLSEFIQIAGFEQGLQYIDAGINFGGQREEESGYYYNIVETDNTLECIWVWSRYYELTGNPVFNQNIDNAWVYAYNFPAWMEGAGYYSAHNCAWALAAEQQFRATLNDSSHWDYAVNSANYLIQTELSFTSSLNVMVTGWCCGNLYLYGEATGNQEYMDIACQRARQIIDWVEESPASRLGLESWAMSSGTFVWGICNSLFKRYPDMGQDWFDTYGPMVQVFEPATGGWSNAWNVAYCNAQGGIFDVTGDSTYYWNQLSLANLLLHHDTDNDGGIPASASGSSAMDASWTTAYLAMMGCDRHIEEGVDAGILAILSPRRNAVLPANQSIPITALAGNWSLSDLTNVMLTVSGAVVDTIYVDLPAGRNTRAFFGYWTPTTAGPDSVRMSIHAVGDTAQFNDSEVSYFSVAASEATGTLETAQIRSFDNGSRIEFLLPADGAVRLQLYDLQGRLVRTVLDGYHAAGEHQIQLDSRSLASGVYFVQLETKTMNQVAKIVIAR